MHEKMKNTLLIVCDDIDLTTISDIEFYIRQGAMFLQYAPRVIDETQMAVEIPKDDAMRLKPSTVRMQFAFRDTDGNPRASEVVVKPVRELLKEAGYDPV